jgi:hypothetical protein
VGVVTIAGALNSVLDPVITTGTGTIKISGICIVTLNVPTMSSGASIVILGNLNSNVAAPILSAAGRIGLMISYRINSNPNPTVIIEFSPKNLNSQIGLDRSVFITLRLED